MIMASYIKVQFKIGDEVVFEAKATIGCIRYGHPRDTLNLFRQGVAKLQQEVGAGNLPIDTYEKCTSFVVGNSVGPGNTEYNDDDLTEMLAEEEQIFTEKRAEPPKFNRS